MISIFFFLKNRILIVSLVEKMVGTPATPLCKMQRTPAATPGGPKAREEKILVTVRMRPLSQREQAMYDLIAWDCVDDHTIIFRNPNHERTANQHSFGISDATLNSVLRF